MMKARGLVLFAIVLVAAPCMAAQMSLPKVQYSSSCQYVTDIDGQAAGLINLISSVVSMIGQTLEIPPYEAMNLENGLNGDGILDQYQLDLLGTALCSSPALQDQLTANKAKYVQLITDIKTVAGILLGSGPSTNVAARLNAVATILEGLSPAPTEVITQIQDAAASCQDLLDGLPAEVTPALVNQLATGLLDFQTAVGALIGLSTEMQQTVLGLLSPSILSQVSTIRGQVVDVISQTASLQSLLSPADWTTVNGVRTDAQKIVDALDRTLALTQPGGIAIFGVNGKTAGEPFSAAGDYDQDGVTNLATYEGVVTCGGGIADFVNGASGYNPYFCGRPGLPVAGLFGLAALAGAVTVGGAFSIRRKK